MAGDDVFLEVALEGSSGAHYPPTSRVFKESISPSPFSTRSSPPGHRLVVSIDFLTRTLVSLPAGCTIHELYARLRGDDEAELSDERKDRAWAKLTQLATSDDFVFVKSPMPTTAYDTTDKDRRPIWPQIEDEELATRAMKLDDPSLRCAPSPAPPDPAPRTERKK